MTNPEKWIIREMKINLSNKQMLDAVLKTSGVSLGESECYVSKIEEDGGGGFNVIVLGSE